MPTQVQSVLRQATRQPNDKLGILSWPTHERYQNGIAKTGHDFYLWRGPNIKDWDTSYGPLPENHFLLDPGLGVRQIPCYADIDLVFSQNKFGQFPIGIQISKQLRLPLVSLEHTLPVPDWGVYRLAQAKNMRGDANVFISEQSMKAWGWKDGEAEVIHHGVDTDLFKPVDCEQLKPHALSVVNDWINRDWCCGFKLWQEITQFGTDKQCIPVRILGNTPGLSKAASSLDELVLAYNQCTVFLNTSTYSPIPSVLLEAMACGKPVVTTDNYVMTDIIRNGVNGYKSNDVGQLRAYCIELLSDPAMAAEMGANARKTILEKFSMETFVNKWNALFRRLTS